jgi:hypothetical protein
MSKWEKAVNAAMLFLGIAVSTQASNLDLTTAGSSGAINGALFLQTDTQPTGTGVIDPFLRLQNSPSETGINTSLDTPNQPILDDKPGIWTHDLALSTLSQVTVNGTAYYKFLLDINQTAASPLLTLDTVKIYVRNQINSLSSLNSFISAIQNNTGQGKNPNYDLGANTVTLNYSLNHGSGSGDMFMYVPVSDLGTDTTGNQFVYLYTQFGVPNASNDGFEEWAAMEAPPSPTNVPDSAATIMLLGTAFLGIEALRRRIRV